MPITPKLLAFAGSTRKDSLNKLLVKIAGKGAEAAGAQVMFLDLKDYPLPYDCNKWLCLSLFLEQDIHM